MWISVSIYVCTYVHMYICIIICVCVCRWYKQPTTGHPGWEAVLLTVRTAHELCSFLPWAGAVSCVSWTCNRGTTEGEWEHFILLSLIPNPSWEWGQSLFSLILNPSWEWGQSPQPILLRECGWQLLTILSVCSADCDKSVHGYR